MKTVLFCSLIVSLSLFANNIADTAINEKEIKLIDENNIREFVENAGSEENAIDKLILFSVPDTFYNTNRQLLWYEDLDRKFTETDYYASLKLQTFYWTIRIYRSDYDNNKNKYCKFIDVSGKPIFDYMDLDVDRKAFLYLGGLSGEQREWYNSLGYIKTNSDSYKELENIFQGWYNEMKVKGLQYMRENKIPPLDSSRYIISDSIIGLGWSDGLFKILP